MNKQILLLFLFLVIFKVDTINAQVTKVDSLENLLKIQKAEDTAEVNLLNKIGYAVYNKNVEKARSYATRAGELSDRLKFLKGKAESLWVMGLSYNKPDKQLANDYFQKALNTARPINYKTGIKKYLTSLAINYNSQKNDSLAIASYEEALKISEEEHDRRGMAKTLINLSLIYREHDNYDKALPAYQKALVIADELNDEALQYSCLTGLGIITSYRGNYPLALEYFQKSIKVKAKPNDTTSAFSGLNNIGNIYLMVSDFPKAFEYFGNALKIAEEQKDQRKMATCYANIGCVYMKMHESKSVEYFRKALAISETIGDEMITISVLIYLGDVYVAQNNFDQALESYHQALKQSEATGKKRPACEILNKIGTIRLKQKKYAGALSSTLKGLELANELKLMDSKNDIHKQLSEIYAAINDYKNAYLHHRLFTEINDSVYNEKNVRKITELEYTYQFEKEKQALILEHQKADAVQGAEKKQQRMIIFSLIMGFLLMVLLAGFVFRSYRIKNKTNLLLMRQKHQIENLNEEYHAINEELATSNEKLVISKNLVEERENLLVQITDNIPVFISLVDRNLEYVFANSGYAGNFNLPKKDIQGRKVKEILSRESFEKVHPILVQTLKGESITFENSMLHEEGRQQILQTTYIPYYQHNEIQGLIVCSDDITDRKIAEQLLKEIEAEKAKLMATEMERIGQELDSNQKSVTAATLKLIQNSERDFQTIERLTAIEESTNPTGKQKINALISDYKRISYNSNWEEFEILFEKVHSSFYARLNAQFPTLTANDRKICAFLKLNMSNKDIAQITFQSDEALKKARLRLRQKLEISREINLVTFLQNI